MAEDTTQTRVAFADLRRIRRIAKEERRRFADVIGRALDAYIAAQQVGPGVVEATQAQGEPYADDPPPIVSRRGN